MSLVGRERIRELQSGRKRGRNLQLLCARYCVKLFHVPFNPLNFTMLVLLLPCVQIGKLRYHVIKYLVLLSVVGKPGMISLNGSSKEGRHGRRREASFGWEQLIWLEQSKNLRCTGLVLRSQTLFSALIPKFRSLGQAVWMTNRWFLVLDA